MSALYVRTATKAADAIAADAITAATNLRRESVVSLANISYCADGAHGTSRVILSGGTKCRSRMYLAGFNSGKVFRLRST